MRTNLKIALISTPMLHCPPRNYGGSEALVFDLACALTQGGHKVALFAPEGSQTPPGGFLVETPPPAMKVESDWLAAEQRMFDVYSKHISDDFDVVHGHGWFGLELDLKHDNIIHTHHGGLTMQFWQHRKHSTVVAISEFMKRVYNNQGFPCRHVCHNGINTEMYRYEENHDGPLLFVGRLDELKRPDWAIEAARRLNMDIDVVGGSFVYNNDYHRKVKAMCDGDGKKVRLHLDATHEEKISLMQKAKAVLITSCFGEPFNLVAVEAMSCGAPVVCTNDGGLPEVVQEGGIVCDVFDQQWTNGQLSYNLKKDPVTAVVEAIRKIDSISSHDARKNAERFSREAMAKRYLEIYRDRDGNRN